MGGCSDASDFALSENSNMGKMCRFACWITFLFTFGPCMPRGFPTQWKRTDKVLLRKPVKMRGCTGWLSVLCCRSCCLHEYLDLDGEGIRLDGGFSILVRRSDRGCKFGVNLQHLPSWQERHTWQLDTRYPENLPHFARLGRGNDPSWRAGS